MKSQMIEGMMRCFIAERGIVMFICMFVGGFVNSLIYSLLGGRKLNCVSEGNK